MLTSGRARVAVACVVLSPVAAAALALVGADAAVRAARDDAASARAHSDEAHAIAVYTSLATRTGPLYLLARHDLAGSSADLEATRLQWARRLASSGAADQAVALLAASGVAGDGTERAGLYLLAARAAVAAGDVPLALARLDAAVAAQPQAPVAAQVDALRRTLDVTRAQQLLQPGGDPEWALLLLDAALTGSPPADVATPARAALPKALLAAAQLAITRSDGDRAIALLDRLEAESPTTPEAQTGRAARAAPQDVSGTVVRRDGSPVSAPVRLATRFIPLNGGYRSGAPYYAGRSDAQGNVVIHGVPVGGPYFLEVDDHGGWVTLVDADKPAQPVTVTPLHEADLGFVVLP